MGKFGLFAFGANESSACMCLYQKWLQMWPYQVVMSASSAPEERRLVPVTPRGFIFTNREWFVAVFDVSYTQAV